MDHSVAGVDVKRLDPFSVDSHKTLGENFSLRNKGEGIRTKRLNASYIVVV